MQPIQDHLRYRKEQPILQVNEANLKNIFVCCLPTQNARTSKLLEQGYRYHKLGKTFSKFYRQHYQLVSKFSVGLKTLLHQGLSEPEFYGDLGL